MLLKTLDEAERFVANQKRLGADIRWDNYDIVFFRPSDKGVYSKNGAYRGGVWGFENRSTVAANGTWEVDPRNVAKRSTRTRN